MQKKFYYYIHLLLKKKKTRKLYQTGNLNDTIISSSFIILFKDIKIFINLLFPVL